MSNLDPEERDKFAALAATWWALDGPSRTLHDINACRVDYIAARADLKGARVADVGCGGGISSEALARAGARVTGIDITAELIDVARRHALECGLAIDYQVATVESLAADRPDSFDAVVCLELVEHVPDAQDLLAQCTRLLRPGGVLVLSTLNRTLSAYALGIVVAEYALGLLPRGTHDYSRFVRPSELARAGRAVGLELRDVMGMSYNPITRQARLRHSPAVNYFASFTRDA